MGNTPVGMAAVIVAVALLTDASPWVTAFTVLALAVTGGLALRRLQINRAAR